MVKRIAIVAAIKDEADILATSLDLHLQKVTEGSYHIYTHTKNGIMMITPGEDTRFMDRDSNPVGRPGKVSAGIVTTILIEKFSPDVIINAGTAAGIAVQGIEIGNIIVANFVANHDIHIPLPGYDMFGKRKIPLENLDVCKKIPLPYRIGTVSSGESFISTHEEWEVMRENNVVAKDMEAAGIVLAVEINAYTHPVYIIKALTDRESEDSSDAMQTQDFIKNFSLAMNNLSVFMREFVWILQNE